jgi:hypothetical protein
MAMGHQDFNDKLLKGGGLQILDLNRLLQEGEKFNFQIWSIFPLPF